MANLRDQSIQANPTFPWLEADDAAGLARVLDELGWLKPSERVTEVERAGEGNMNLTLRVVTNERSFVLKQARPWVEKYPEIAAPWDRSRVEQRFYERIASIPQVAHRMPRVFGRSATARVIVMEDLRDAEDLSSLYSGGRLNGEELEALADYLAGLHGATAGETDPILHNEDMRALNHEHIYRLPLDMDNGLALDDHEPGLAAAARGLAADGAFVASTRALGRRYLAKPGARSRLLHGDFFPGSWLRVADGLRIIDPEFAYLGDPEFDVACAVAHIALAGLPAADAETLLQRYAAHDEAPHLDLTLVAGFAAAEVMRRLIGVAQLPLPAHADDAPGPRTRLLERTRQTMLAAEVDRLFPGERA